MVLWSIVEWSVAGHLTKGETQLKNPALGLFEVWLFLVRVSETICFKLRESLPKGSVVMSLYTPGLFNLEAENDEALESTLEVEVYTLKSSWHAAVQLFGTLSYSHKSKSKYCISADF